jgi:LPXTG-motif cell wall-anchored protein
MPFIEEHHGVWVITASMVVLAAGIWFFFKKKKWV